MDVARAEIERFGEVMGRHDAVARVEELARLGGSRFSGIWACRRMSSPRSPPPLPSAWGEGEPAALPPRADRRAPTECLVNERANDQPELLHAQFLGRVTAREGLGEVEAAQHVEVLPDGSTARSSTTSNPADRNSAR